MGLFWRFLRFMKVYGMCEIYMIYSETYRIYEIFLFIGLDLWDFFWRFMGFMRFYGICEIYMIYIETYGIYEIYRFIG